MTVSDQNFRSQYGAKLIGDNSLFDPFKQKGDESDDAYYVMRPGVDFLRPWLGIRGGAAFQWPLGVEGFSISIDPTLGIHKYIGDNKVAVDVIHSGQENITLSGSFPGTQGDPNTDSSIQAFRNLRELVYRDTPNEGKILYVPLLMSNAQLVVVAHAQFDRTADERGTDMSYSIDFVRLGLAAVNPDVVIPQPSTQPSIGGQNGKSAKHISVDAKHNTLRKIAAWKYGNADAWRTAYDKNKAYFLKHSISMQKVPNYHLPLGTKVYY